MSRAIDPENRLDRHMVGGDHYQKMPITPWQALEVWLTPEEFRGYLKGEAIVYIARELAKAGPTDIGKARHTLQKLEQVYGPEEWRMRRESAVPSKVDDRDPDQMSAAELALIPLPPLRVEASPLPGFVFVNGHVYELRPAGNATGGCTVPEVCAMNGRCAKPGSGCPFGGPVVPLAVPAGGPQGAA